MARLVQLSEQSVQRHERQLEGAVRELGARFDAHRVALDGVVARARADDGALLRTLSANVEQRLRRLEAALGALERKLDAASDGARQTSERAQTALMSKTVLAVEREIGRSVLGVPRAPFFVAVARAPTASGDVASLSVDIDATMRRLLARQSAALLSLMQSNLNSSATPVHAMLGSLKATLDAASERRESLASNVTQTVTRLSSKLCDARPAAVSPRTPAPTPPPVTRTLRNLTSECESAPVSRRVRTLCAASRGGASSRSTTPIRSPDSTSFSKCGERPHAARRDVPCANDAPTTRTRAHPQWVNLVVQVEGDYLDQRQRDYDDALNCTLANPMVDSVHLMLENHNAVLAASECGTAPGAGGCVAFARVRALTVRNDESKSRNLPRLRNR